MADLVAVVTAARKRLADEDDEDAIVFDGGSMSGKRNYVWNGETFVDVTGWKRPPQRFPSIRRDTMDAAVHPATGEVMDSKSRFREVTKARARGWGTIALLT